MIPANISAIIFDLGNVLFDLDIPRTWRALENLLDVKFDHPFAYPPTKELMYGYETGAVDTGTFVGELQRLSRPGTTAEEVVNAWNAMLLTMPAKRFELLESLKEQFPLFLLSNINSLHLEYFYSHVREAHGIRNWDAAYFEQTFYSNYIGLRKPDKAIYEHVLDCVGLPAEQLLFVDDNEHNIREAQSLGIQTIHLGETAEVADHPFFQTARSNGQ